MRVLNEGASAGIAAPSVRSAPAAIARPVVISTAAELLVLALTLVSLRLAAAFGPLGFGIYAIARRAVQLIAYPALLGLGTGLPRFVAIDAETGCSGGSRALLGAALLVMAPAMAVVALGTTVLPSALSRLLYGTGEYRSMIPAVALAIIGLGMFTVAHGFYRGRMAFGSAAALQMLGAGLIPVGAILLASGPVMAIALTGAGWLLAGGAFYGRAYRTAGAGQAAPLRPLVLTTAGALARYGALRVPGEFALFGFFALPVLFVAHRLGTAEAGYLSLGLSIVTVVASGLAGVGVVLLPYVSRAMVTGERRDTGAAIGRIALATFLAAGAVTVVAYISAPELIPRFFGAEYAAAVPITQTTVLGIVPYSLYAVLRGPLDGATVWPHNSINLSISLAIALALLLGGAGLISAAAAVAIGLTVLGALSALSWGSAMRRPVTMSISETVKGET